MKTAAHRSMLALALAVPLGLAACGGDDEQSPEEVARSYYEARYDCGEKSAGRLFDLTTGSRSGRSREEFVRDVVEQERAEGCRPERAPEIETFEVSKESDRAVVEVRLQNAPDGKRGGRIQLLQTDDGWRVDTGAGGG